MYDDKDIVMWKIYKIMIPFFLCIFPTELIDLILYMNFKSDLPGRKVITSCTLSTLLPSSCPGFLHYCVIKLCLCFWSTDPKEGFPVFRLHFFVFFLLCSQNFMISSIHYRLSQCLIPFCENKSMFYILPKKCLASCFSFYYNNIN